MATRLYTHPVFLEHLTDAPEKDPNSLRFVVDGDTDVQHRTPQGETRAGRLGTGSPARDENYEAMEARATRAGLPRVTCDVRA